MILTDIYIAKFYCLPDVLLTVHQLKWHAPSMQTSLMKMYLYILSYRQQLCRPQEHLGHLGQLSQIPCPWIITTLKPNQGGVPFHRSAFSLKRLFIEYP
jgi:hypothetical protein